MSLRRKEILTGQKEYAELKLANRLAALAGKGIEGKKAGKDPLAKEYKAEVKAADRRLNAVAAHVAITEAGAKVKAERLAAPKEKEKEAVKPEKAEKPKKGGEAPKEKKPKPEKKAAPAKAE